MNASIQIRADKTPSAQICQEIIPVTVMMDFLETPTMA